MKLDADFARGHERHFVFQRVVRTLEHFARQVGRDLWTQQQAVAAIEQHLFDQRMDFAGVVIAAAAWRIGRWRRRFGHCGPNFSASLSASSDSLCESLGQLLANQV